MEEVDWSKVPDGTTHFWPGLVLLDGWYKILEGDVWVYDGGWVKSLVSLSDLNVESIIKRPVESWGGETPPPAGTICEWKEKTGFQWVKAEILFVSEQSIVLRRFDGFEWQLNPNRLAFRVFKTPEQIKAEELQIGVQKIMDDAGITDSAFKDDPEAWVWAAALYNKGYKLQEDK